MDLGRVTTPDSFSWRYLRLGVRRLSKHGALSFGPEALVLEPERLKEIVRKDLSKNLAQYLKPPVSIKLIKEIRAI